MLALLLSLLACPVTVPGDTATALPQSTLADTASALPASAE